MYIELLWLILIFVPLLLTTYWQVTFSSLSMEDLWGGLSPKLAAMTGVPTVIAVFYLTFVWIWPPDGAMLYGVPYESNRHLVLLTYSALLGGAILWSPFTQLALYREERRGYVTFAIMLVAIATVSLFVHTLAWSSDNQAWMILASTICMIHHVILDACIWNSTFHVPETTPMFSIDDENRFRPLRFDSDARA